MLDSSREKMKARAEVGREEEGPLCDPGCELLLGGSARVRIINGMMKKICRKFMACYYYQEKICFIL